MHVGNVAFLWLLSVDIGLFYFFVPRLCGVSLWSGRYGLCGGCNLVGLDYGDGVPAVGRQRRLGGCGPAGSVGRIEVKMLFTIAFLLTAINLYATIAVRRFEKMYVSLWYVMGTLLWTTFTYIVGSYAVYWVPGGISRVNVNFFYVHNLVGLIYTPMGLAIAYYFLPKLANIPIYSHRYR